MFYYFNFDKFLKIKLNSYENEEKGAIVDFKIFQRHITYPPITGKTLVFHIVLLIFFLSKPYSFSLL